MPAVFRGVCPAETLLDHVVMKQIDFAEIDAPEAHARDRLITVRLAAALPIHLFFTARQVYQQMRIVHVQGRFLVDTTYLLGL